MKKMRLVGSKVGQQTMSMPFNLIFSIILIITFLVAAIFGIKYFLKVGDCSQIGLFYESFQKEVDQAYYSTTTSFEYKLGLPAVRKVCFANLTAPITGSKDDYEQIERYTYDNANLFLIPPEKSCDLPSKNIAHINISAITKTKNPYCVETGKIVIISFDPYKQGNLVIIK